MCEQDLIVVLIGLATLSISRSTVPFRRGQYNFRPLQLRGVRKARIMRDCDGKFEDLFAEILEQYALQGLQR
jgi:hypothetical protein